MNLDGLFTRTTVAFSASSRSDSLLLNKKPIFDPGLSRVTAMPEVPERAKPTPAQQRAQRENVKKAQAARHRK